MKTIDKLRDSQAKLNAVVTLIDQQNEVKGPLSHVEIAVKDNFSTKGILTTASCKILDNYVPVFDATVIEKLKAAGAQLVCKTTMDELAMGGTGLTPSQGPTHNPYDFSRIAGGSSSGSAAVVGAHLVDYALGSDTGDSVRKPAHYCGIVGFKPTYGLISRFGVVAYASSLDHVGYFTRTVGQAAKLLSVLAERDDRDLTSLNVPSCDYTQLNPTLEGKVIGVLDDLFEIKEEDEMKQRYRELLQQLESQGATIKHFRMDPWLLKAIVPVYFLIANSEATANHACLDGVRYGHRQPGQNLQELMTQSRTKGFGSALKKRFIIGAYGLDDQHQEDLFRKAQRVRRLIVNEYRAILDQCDILLNLSGDDIAPTIDEMATRTLSESKQILENYLILDNFAGTPSVTIPLGFKGHLPYGVSLAAQVTHDKQLLEIAQAIETLIDFEPLDKEKNPWITK